MPDFTVAQHIDDFMKSSDNTDARDTLGVTGAISTAIAPLETDIAEIQNDQLDLTIATGLDDRLYYYDATTLVSGSIPTAIKSVRLGNQVTAIGNSAFHSTQLTSITLTENVTSINTSAFENSQITTIIIPEGLTSIGDHAFSTCYSLGNIDFPSSLDSIGYFSFFAASITLAILPEGLTSIGSYAFYSSALTSVTLPESLTSIGSSAFYFCTSLTEANIYTTKTVIDATANLFVLSGLTTVYARASDATWTEGTGLTIGGKSGVEVIKNL